MVLFLMRFNIFIVPIAQPICMGVFLILTIWSFFYVCLTLKGIKMSYLLYKFRSEKNK